VQPRSQRVSQPQRTAFPDKHQERGLERVFGRVFISQDGTTCPDYTRTVSFNEGSERHFGRVILAGGKSFQEFPVRQAISGSSLV
jgi:hypothetical protein